MGASSSISPDGGSLTAKYGHLLIKTDKITYKAGETVTGYIYTYLFQEIPADKLYLRLKGREHTEIKTQGKKHSNHHLTQKTIFLDSVVPIQIQSTTLKGQNAIPFAFVLDDNLPTTFLSKGHKYYADVRYRLEVFVEPLVKGEPKLKYKHEIAVHQPVQFPAHLKEERDIPLKGMCCCGSPPLIPMKAIADKRVVYPGEVINLDIAIDLTNIKATCEKVIVNLFHIIMLDVGMQGSKRILQNKALLELPGRRSGEVAKIQAQLRVPYLFYGPPIKSGYLSGMIDSLKDESGLISCPMRSKNIHACTFIQVMPKFVGYDYSWPALFVPIDILYPEIPVAPLTTPPDWYPQQHATNNLVFNVKDKNAKKRIPYDDKLDPTPFSLYGIWQ